MTLRTKDDVEFQMGMTLYLAEDGHEGLNWKQVDTDTTHDGKPYYGITKSGKLGYYLRNHPEIQGGDENGDHLIPSRSIDEFYASRDLAVAEAIKILDQQIACLENEKRLLLEGFI